MSELTEKPCKFLPVSLKIPKKVINMLILKYYDGGLSLKSQAIYIVRHVEKNETFVSVTKFA